MYQEIFRNSSQKDVRQIKAEVSTQCLLARENVHYNPERILSMNYSRLISDFVNPLPGHIARLYAGYQEIRWCRKRARETV